MVLTETQEAQTRDFEDGRVSYRKIGQGSRRVLFFHGFPGSSIQIELFRPYLDDCDLQVICIDRPGYNQTSPRPGSQFEQTQSVVERVLAEHRWTRFEVVSVSGGTPFAFHSVRTFGRNVQALRVVCGLGPVAASEFRGMMSAFSMSSLRLVPHLPGRPIRRLIERAASSSKVGRPRYFRWFMPVSRGDLECIANPELKEPMNIGLRESVRQDALGPQQDARAFLTPWELSTGPYQGPIMIWHGSEDPMIPPCLARRMNDCLPGSMLTMVDGEGHYSLPIRQMGTILKTKPNYST